MSKYCKDCGQPKHDCCCHHHPVRPTPLPPLPAPYSGDSNYELLGHYWKRIDNLERSFQHVLCDANSTLKVLERRAVHIGGYYSPKTVKLEEGYSAEDGAVYFLTRINHIDSTCKPVIPELRLAYKSTTNSEVKEPMFEASISEIADKMWPANPTLDGGWMGHVVQNGVPLPSNADNDYWTVGFTKRGRLKVYSNRIDPVQLRKDQIYNSMGCYGVTALDGQWTDASYRAQIPNQDTLQARVLMGQNPETKQTFVLSTGAYDNNGMLTRTATDILLGYGCSTVVEMVNGADAAMTDKGRLLFTPEEKERPRMYAYWYISRKRSFTNDYQRELAVLYQKLGAQQWELYLIRNEISDLQNTVGDHESRLASLEARMTAAEASITELLKLVDRVDIIEATIQDIEDRLALAEAQVELNKADIAALKIALASLQATVVELNTLVMMILDSVNELKTIVERIEQYLASLGDLGDIQNIITQLNDHEARIAALETWRPLIAAQITGLRDSIVHETSEREAADSAIWDELNRLSSTYSIRGSVQNYSDLASVTPVATNDGWIVIDDETRGDQTSVYVWSGTDWVYSGRLGIDVANYYDKTEIDNLLAQIEAGIPPDGSFIVNTGSLAQPTASAISVQAPVGNLGLSTSTGPKIEVSETGMLPIDTPYNLGSANAAYTNVFATSARVENINTPGPRLDMSIQNSLFLYAGASQIAPYSDLIVTAGAPSNRFKGVWTDRINNEGTIILATSGDTFAVSASAIMPLSAGKNLGGAGAANTYSNAYISTTHGNLDGNATTATTATNLTTPLTVNGVRADRAGTITVPTSSEVAEYINSYQEQTITPSGATGSLTCRYYTNTKKLYVFGAIVYSNTIPDNATVVFTLPAFVPTPTTYKDVYACTNAFGSATNKICTCNAAIETNKTVRITNNGFPATTNPRSDYDTLQFSWQAIDCYTWDS